jgi:hypothetical protein
VGESVIDAYHIEHVMMSKNHGLSPSTVVSTAEAEKFTFAIVLITSVAVDTSAAVLFTKMIPARKIRGKEPCWSVGD